MSPRLTLALLVGVTVLVIGPQLGHGLVLYDVGEVFFFAGKLGRGLRPGVDFTINAYGPGRYLLFAGLFALTGPSTAVMGAVWLLLRVGITVLAWSVARRFVPRTWALLPVICLLVAPGPLHKGFYLLGTLAITWSLLRYLDRPERRRAATFGLILAAVALFRLDLGGFGVLAALLAIPGEPGGRRNLVVALAPLAWGLAITAVVLLGTGTFGPVFAQLWDDIFKNQTIAFPTFPGPGRLLAGDVDAFFLWSPILVYSALLVHFVSSVRREGEDGGRAHRRRVALLLVLGVLTCNQVRMKPEYGHLLQSGPLLWTAAAVLLHRLSDPRRMERFALASGLAASLVAALALHTLGAHRGSIYTGSFTIPLERTFPLNHRLGTSWLNAGEYAELAPTLEWLDRQEPGPVWVPTNQPLLYALSGREDVTGHVGVVYYADLGDAQRTVIERLERHKPAIAVFVDDSIEGPERTLGRAAPRVASYLETEYRLVQRFGRYQLLQRR